MGVKFPPTERKAAGISAGEMFKELLKPMFFVLFCSMFLTAASELAPGQWVDLALTPHGGDAGHPAAGLRQRADVRDAALRGTTGAQAFADRRTVVLLSGRVAGVSRAELREFAGDGTAGGNVVGHGSLLHVADHARDRVRTFPARRSAAHGTDGHGRDAVDPVRAADHGERSTTTRRSRSPAARRRSMPCNPAPRWSTF